VAELGGISGPRIEDQPGACQFWIHKTKFEGKDAAGLRPGDVMKDCGILGSVAPLSWMGIARVVQRVQKSAQNRLELKVSVP